MILPRALVLRSCKSSDERSRCIVKVVSVEHQVRGAYYTVGAVARAELGVK
jgi:hypothetical protein